jgi:23S rRNA (cytidine1920-2'-O)/16S rRNA (cytidine1409-2'-O)-methyltransferase
LIKPQFEVGRGKVERGGLVRDPERHREVLREFVEFARSRGWARRGLCRSALPGARGNQEFFLHLAAHGIADADAATCERWIDAAIEAGLDTAS